ncbi:hypothetical protein Ahy_B07g086195 [Arachis hypogaea]|uniref:Uncharacterized protein n=1 Tax=Arachis hypogaea TaxID=3818 RepID=A0A444Y957_ARAHY|nr:hypothetical protein Ahy_B07g086195 [Arachis hypogaea]
MDFAEGKSPLLEKQPAEMKDKFKKFETPVKRKELSAEMKEKCYLWATCIKTYGDGSTNDVHHRCPTTIATVKNPFASLKPSTYIESEIVNAICLILNQQNIRRFEEEIYCLPPNIVNMAIENHEGGEFLQPKTKKPFNIEDYKMFIPYLDLKKLASHPYVIIFVGCILIFGCSSVQYKVYYGVHWVCNLGYVISRMRVYANGAPLKKDDREIEPPYINISGKRQSIKSFSLKIAEVDHFRVEYASHILFYKMNQDRDIGIRESEAIRLSKPSTVLLSP